MHFRVKRLEVLCFQYEARTMLAVLQGWASWTLVLGVARVPSCWWRLMAGN